VNPFRLAPPAMALALALLACSAGAVVPSRKYAAEPRSTGLVFENVTFPSMADSVPIAGWWFPSAEPAPAVVLCPRGRGNMADLLPAGREFARRGFAVLLFDPRDFGPAGAGDADTLRDLVFATRWVDDTEAALRYARSRANGQPVFAWGQDLGASLALVASARAPGRADGIVVEGVFRTTTDQLGYLGLSADAELQRHQRAVTQPRDEPFSAASRLQSPALVVVAGKDDVTPAATTRSVFQRARTAVAWWELPAAKHDGAETTPGYFDRVAQWMSARAKLLAGRH
jgi:alpha-beta hydrolase superfamily lysophospholipase